MKRRSLMMIAAAMVLAACGDADPSPSARAGGATLDAAAGTSSRDAARLPAIEVTDLAGGSVRLADLAPSEKPILVWFWAPHCPSCHAEAADVEAFSKRAAGSVTVVGLGAQDDEEMAQEFIREHALTTPRMLYDPTFESWRHFGINGQPAAILFDRGGTARAGWFGAFPEKEVLSLADRL